MMYSLIGTVTLERKTKARGQKRADISVLNEKHRQRGAFKILVETKMKFYLLIYIQRFIYLVVAQRK